MWLLDTCPQQPRPTCIYGSFQVVPQRKECLEREAMTAGIPDGVQHGMPCMYHNPMTSRAGTGCCSLAGSS